MADKDDFFIITSLKVALRKDNMAAFASLLPGVRLQGLSNRLGPFHAMSTKLGERIIIMKCEYRSETKEEALEALLGGEW